MSTEITTTGVHHIRLIVTDPVRSRDFYTSLLNFKVAVELPPGFVLTNGDMLLGITPPWDASQALHIAASGVSSGCSVRRKCTKSQASAGLMSSANDGMGVPSSPVMKIL